VTDDPTVVLVDVTGPDGPPHLADLLALHRRHFPGHAHVLPELEENAVLAPERGGLVVHQVVAYVAGAPVGFVVVHANLDRSIGLIHFLAVDEALRGVPLAAGPDEDRPPAGLRPTAASTLVARAEALVEAAGVRAGRPVRFGTVAESEPDVVSSWRRWGYGTLEVAYAEPYFGRHWADHGPPTFFEMTLVHRGGAYAGAPLDAVARAACDAYLLDHYRLPADHPKVEAIVASIPPGRG
jgi:hypothetical protein